MGCSLIPEPPVKQTSRHTSCLAICRPFELNVKLFWNNLDLGLKSPTLPSEERTNGSSKWSFFYLRLQVWVKRKEKKKQKSINQRLRKSKTKEKEKKINRSKIEEKKKRGSMNQTMSKQCAELSKARKKGKVAMTWLKPEGCVKNSPAYLQTKSLCPLWLRICRNLPFGGRARRNKKGIFSWRKRVESPPMFIREKR